MAPAKHLHLIHITQCTRGTIENGCRNSWRLVRDLQYKKKSAGLRTFVWKEPEWRQTGEIFSCTKKRNEHVMKWHIRSRVTMWHHVIRVKISQWMWAMLLKKFKLWKETNRVWKKESRENEGSHFKRVACENKWIVQEKNTGSWMNRFENHKESSVKKNQVNTSEARVQTIPGKGMSRQWKKKKHM